MFVILGATGRVGRTTIGRLREQGKEVRAVVRAPSDAASRLRDLGCEIAFADLTDSVALGRAFMNAQAVQVICPTRPQAEDATAEMKQMIASIVAALTEVPPPHILAISDYGAQRPAGTGIALLYHHLEQELSRLPAGLTFLRSCEHLQNLSRVIRLAVDRGVLASFHHPLTKPFPAVSAMDVGEVAAELLLTTNAGVSPRIAHVEGLRRVSAIDLAMMLGPILQREITPVALARADWMQALSRGGLSESYAQLVVDMYDAHNAGLIDVETGVGQEFRGRSEPEAVLRSLLA